MILVSFPVSLGGISIFCPQDIGIKQPKGPQKTSPFGLAHATADRPEAEMPPWGAGEAVGGKQPKGP